MTHQHGTLEDTLYFWFASNDTSGSGGDGASAAADVRLAGALASAAPVLSPAPSLLSHANYPPGCYEVAVAATAANGFAADNTYGVYCTLAIDSQNPTGFIGSFSLFPIRADAENVSTGSASISTTAESFTKAAAEPETNTYTATHQLDGTYHIVEDDTGTTDVYYQFDVGGDGVPTEFLWDGYAQSNGDTYTIYAYNWGGTSWDQIGTIAATNGTTPLTFTWQATTSHVGTGANLGKVRLRLYSTDGTAVATDRVLCSYAVVSRSVGYALGAIWVDTSASNTNTESYVDGVADNPVSTWAAALTLSGNLGLKRFMIAAGGAITLSANSDNYEIYGPCVTVTLNAQSVSGTVFNDCIISGNDDGSNTTPTRYVRCEIGNSTLGKHILEGCRHTGNITLAEAADYLWDQCASFVAGNGTPDVTFPVGNANLNVRHYSGGMEINSMAAGDTMSFEADGQFKIAASCTGGAVSIRGCVGPITDAAGGAVTLTENARISDDTINAEVDTAIVDAKLDHLVAVADSDDAVDNSIIAKLASATSDWSTFVAASHSLEAIRVRGDAAWITGGGGSLTQIINPTPVIPTSIDLANTATIRLGIMVVNSVDDLPSTAEITPGTISIDRKAIGGTSWSAIATDAACSEAAGLIYYDEVFDSGTGYAEGDSIRITFKSQAVVADANTHEITGTGGVIFYTEVRQTMRGTDSAATASSLSTVETKIDGIIADLPQQPTKNVALNNFTFLMVDETDHVTAETGLTVSGFISKDGGAFSPLTNSVSEIGNGMYKVNITQAEMNADSIILRFTATGADDRFVSLLTQPT